MSCANTFYIKQGDRKEYLVATLKDSNGNAIDVSGLTVKFIMAADTSTTPVINGACTLTDPSNGIVTYEWQAGDTSTAGTYIAEFQIDDSGEYRTVPTKGYLTIIIVDDIAD